MPDAVCIKAGGIDDKAVRDFKTTAVEFYCKDRMAYSKAVEGAEQKPVSNPPCAGILCCGGRLVCSRRGWGLS